MPDVALISLPVRGPVRRLVPSLLRRHSSADVAGRPRPLPSLDLL